MSSKKSTGKYTPVVVVDTIPEHSVSSDALFITATLNCLGTLLRTRQSISNKIMSVILNFNPLKQANSPMNPKAKVHIKAMDRTTRSLLMNMLRRYVLIRDHSRELG